MQQAGVEATVLFADVVGSSRLYAVGDDATGRQLLTSCLALMQEIMARHGGEVIDRVGDELLCTFPTADIAAEAAVALHRDSADAHLQGCLSQPLRLRVGFEHGSVIRTEEGLFGNTVHVGARLVSLAKPGQSLTTRTTLERLCSMHRGNCRFFDTVVLKGQSGEQEIFELLWNARATYIPGALPRRLRAPAAGSGLTLLHGAHSYRVDAEVPQLDLGRDPACDVHVEGPTVSSRHARLLWNKGHASIVDMSSNGTLVLPDGAAAVRLHHDSLRLRGSGVMWLGIADFEGKNSELHYRLELSESRA